MNKEFQTLRKKQRFSLRKLNIGVASVLLGFTIFGYNLASQAPVAHAATSAVATPSAGSSETEVVSGSPASNSRIASATGSAANASQATSSTQGTASVKQTESVTNTTASAGSGASGSSATGGVGRSQGSNSQAASTTSSAANASQATSSTQVTVPAASQSSESANLGNATSSPASQAGTTSANHTASSTNTTPSSQTVSLDEATSPAVQARTLMMNLAVINPDTDTLPKSTQTYTLVSQPLLTDYRTHLHDGKRDGNTWVDKNLYWYRDSTLDTIFGTTSKSKPGIITSHPDKYFFGAYVDYNSSYHRVILLARSQDPNDNNLYSYTIHTGKQKTSSTTAAPNTDTQEVYGGVSGSKYDLIFKNYQGKSYAVILKGFEHGDGEYGLLPVFDGGLLDPTYGSNTYDQNDEAAKTKSIGFWSNMIPQETSTKVRYVDQATGKDIVQPMEISGFGYQGFKVNGDAPTVKGYHLVSSPKSLGLPYEDGTIAPYKVGQTYDLPLSDSVVIKQTVINTDGTVRATAYYKGSRLPSTDASKVLGRESYNDYMSFDTPDGFYAYTNRIDQVDDSYIYYYAKDSDPNGSEMRLHFIDVTGVNNSSYAPSDGPELDADKVKTIQGNIGDSYSFTYTVPKGYDQVAASGVTGTYSVTHHDAYVYVKANTPKPVTTPVKTNENTTLTDDQAKAGIANNADLPADTTYTWSQQPDTTQPGDTTGEVTVHYKDGSSETVTVPVHVNSEAETNTPKVSTPTVDQNAEVDPTSVVTNQDTLPKGTTYSWKTKPDTAKAGQPATGSLHVAYPDGSSEDVPVTVKVKSNADQYTPTVPGDKVTVKDPSHLTEGEKDQVKNNVDNANKDKFPDGTKVTVGDDGTATVNYPDGSKDVIAGTDLVIAAKSEDVPGSKHHSYKNGSNSSQADGVKGASTANGSIANAGNNLAVKGESDNAFVGVKGESDNAIGNNKATSLKTLPQTGTKDTSILGVLGMLLASLGLFVFKKKRDKE
ncbi:Rib/alpha-like domain-containing protein [Lactobacillus crispatus]|uniref:Rib/alpha-like domain-containing protein n=1 Tax=Lactobacillus crispatus TaxID=47770 RepID=UPI0007619967|nr:Rib/alpha-like domain-containing protein [Lactobacillus crispatus]